MTHPTRIAIVDCDDLIQALLSRCLEQAGFAVHHTSVSSLDGLDAQLVIADTPSAQAAPALVTRLRGHTPAPLLLLSPRFPRRAAGSTALAERLGVQAVLPIPFTEASLLALVREALDSR